MKTLLKVPYNAMEVIHRDYNILSDFIHVQEFETENSLLEYSDNHLENLENALFDYLEKSDYEKVGKLIIKLNKHISTAIGILTARANNIKRDISADYISHRNPVRYE